MFKQGQTLRLNFLYLLLYSFRTPTTLSHPSKSSELTGAPSIVENQTKLDLLLITGIDEVQRDSAHDEPYASDVRLTFWIFNVLLTQEQISPHLVCCIHLRCPELQHQEAI